MRILILSQFFNPEPTFKGIGFAKELEAIGHHVSVLTAFPNYPGGKVYPGYKIRLLQKEVMDGISILRVPIYPSHDRSKLRRAWNYISFCLSSFFALLVVSWRFDVIYVYHPPATVGLSAAFASIFTRTPFVYDIQDLWPDTLAATGMLNNPKVLKLIGWVCQFIYWRAQKIVVLSDGFRRRLIGRGVPGEKIQVIYNWCDEASLAKDESAVQSLLQDGKFNIVFAGNMGPAQQLEVVLAAAKVLQVSNPSIHFVFVGDGISLNELKEIKRDSGLGNVTFIPRMSPASVGGLLRRADALLVHLKNDPLFEITIPSKTQAYLAMGKPVLMGVLGDGALLVEKANAGICFQPGSVEDLVHAVLKMATMDKVSLGNLGKNAQTFYFEELSIKTGTKKFETVFRECL